MSVVHISQSWNYSKTVTVSDTVENARNAVGIVCNADGAVGITYLNQDIDGVPIDGVIQVARGIPFFLPPIIRVRSTGTAGPTAIELLVA